MATLSIQAAINENDTYNRFEKRNVTTTGDKIDARKIDVLTSEVTHTIDSGITSNNGPGACFIYNSDATNFVQAGFASGNYVFKIPALSGWVVPLDPAVTTLYLLADTSTCEVEIQIREA